MRRRQSGIVMIAMLAVIMMSAAWFTVRSLAALPGDYTAANRARNAEVLARAKAALMGHVALQAAKAGELPPGLLFLPYGDLSSRLMGGDTHGTGMPNSKGFDVELEKV